MLAGATLAVPQVASAAPLDAKLWNGTWHLHPAKSKFASSTREQSETRTYAVSGNKVTMKSTSKDRGGKAMSFSYSAALDGKWYPMTGNPSANRISLTAVSARELKANAHLNDKPSVEAVATVSADGKQLTIKRKMLRQDGAPTDVLEFHR
jgi:hypothetical protein